MTSYKRLERRIGKLRLEVGGSKHRQWTRSKPDRKARKARRKVQAASRRKNRGAR